LSQNGKLSTSIGFDGADDSIQIPSSSGDELDITSDLTVSAWLKWKGPSDPPDIYYPRILEKSYQTSYMFSLRPDDATRLSVWIENGERASTPSGSLSLNEWHHAAFTFDDAANTVKIYIDGIQQGSGSYTGSITGSSNDVYIGRYPQSAVAFWNGTMDEVAVWNRSLTAGEILDIYKRGALRLNLSVRSCDDSSCDTEQFADITDISPQDLERGRAAFLARIRSKLDTGDTSGIRAAAGRLLHFYEESPDRLDAEVSAQLKINSSDLLGDTGLQEEKKSVVEERQSETVENERMGPVEKRILELIRAEEELQEQRNFIRKMSDTSRHT